MENSTDFYHLADGYLIVVRNWQMSNIWTISVYAVLLYLIGIYSGKRWMEKRKRYELRYALVLWNLLLSAFSFYGMVGLGTQMIRILRSQGFHSLVCNPSHTDPDNMAWAYWGLLFVDSKFLELGDTFFIILRKQPLIFLHWYHHITALLYCTYSVIEQNPPALPFAVINLTVHGYMYFYYTLKSSKVSVPKGVAMAITSSQIAQMVAAVSATAYCIGQKLSGRYCGVSDNMLKASLLLYLSFAVLFASFFYKSYFGKRRPIKDSPTRQVSDKKLL